jgi:HK97 family phage portal protein
MSFLSRLFSKPPAPQAKYSAAGVANSAIYRQQVVWTDRRFEDLVREAYIRNAVAFRCVKLISSAAASIPWVLRKNRKEKYEHELLDLLAKPNPLNGGHAFMEALYAYLLLAGNSYMEMVTSSSSGTKPRELWLIRPDRMEVIAGNFGLPERYRYQANGQIVEWAANPITNDGPIIHFRDFHPLNDWYGLSRVEPAAYAVDRNTAATAHNVSLIQNGARPTGALIFKPVTVDGRTTTAPEEILQQAEDRLQDRHMGASNAGRPMVFGGNVEWEQMAISPRDMDFNESKNDSARDICTAFGVPFTLLVPGQSTYNNIKEAKLELYEDTVIPLVTQVRDMLNMKLAPKFNTGLKLDFDLDSVLALEPRREIKREATMKLYKEQVITRDEAREELGFDQQQMYQVKPDPIIIDKLTQAVEKGVLPKEVLNEYIRAVGLTKLTDEQLDELIEEPEMETDDSTGDVSVEQPEPEDGDEVDDSADGDVAG